MNLNINLSINLDLLFVSADRTFSACQLRFFLPLIFKTLAEKLLVAIRISNWTDLCDSCRKLTISRLCHMSWIWPLILPWKSKQTSKCRKRITACFVRSSNDLPEKMNLSIAKSIALLTRRSNSLTQAVVRRISIATSSAYRARGCLSLQIALMAPMLSHHSQSSLALSSRTDCYCQLQSKTSSCLAPSCWASYASWPRHRSSAVAWPTSLDWPSWAWLQGPS